MTGTIKKAPCQLMLSARRQSLLDGLHDKNNGIKAQSACGKEFEIDSESDEEQFPPPPPQATVSTFGEHCRGIHG